MVFVRRDDKGDVCGISESEQEGFVYEELDSNEVLGFLIRIGDNKSLELLRSDLQFIRVLEDLIELLIKKNQIAITDFPQTVVDKLLQRQSIRNHFTGSLGMEFYDDEDQ